MQIKDIYEFLLYDNCKNKCSFCFQRNNPRIFNKNQRQFVLDNTLKFIDSAEFIKGSHILLVGGEIFDTPSDSEMLSKFFDEIVKRMLDNTIDLLYINTNLIYSDCICLFNFLELIEWHNLFDRLRFTTSYDQEGRFKTDKDRQLMLSNLEEVKRLFPKCQIVVNCILTKQMCEAILNKSFNPLLFMEKYRCWINFIPYIISDLSLVADRNLIFKTLKQIDNDNPGYLDKYITNLDLAQEKKLYMYKDNKFQYCSCELSECGHAVNFKKYSSNNTCFICDLKELFNDK